MAKGVTGRAEVLPCPVGCGPLRPFDVPAKPRPVAVDVCPSCGGAWFDAGEVQAVASAGVAPRRDAAPAAAKARAEPSPAAPAPEDLDAEDAEPTRGWYLLATLTGLPLEGYNPVYRKPVVTWALVGACALVFGVQWLVGPSMVERYGLVPQLLVSRGESPVRLLGSMFLHGDLLHLLGNLYFLKVFGDNVEDRLGRGWYLGFYLASGLGASGLYVALSASSTAPAIGASGAIAGALGAYLVFFPRARVRLVPVLSVAASVIVGALFFSGPYPALSAVVVIAVLLCGLPALALYSRGSDLALLRPVQLRAMYYLPLWFLWQVVSAARGTGGVAWWAHIGGFVTGMALAKVLAAFVKDPRVGATES